MRIAFLSVSSQMGGSERSLVELVRALKRLRPHWALTVVHPGDGPIDAAAREAGADTVTLPMPRSLARFGESGLGGLAANSVALIAAAGAAALYARDLRKLLAALAVDLVHSNGFKHHVIAAAIADPRRPLVWHIHEYVTPRRLSRTLLRRCAGRVAAAVANSRSVARDLAAAVGPALPIETIYNGIDLSEYAPEGDLEDLDARAGLPPPSTVRVGLVATFGRWKGHDVFLRAIQKLDPSLPVRAYVVGGAVYDTARSEFSAGELGKLAADLGVADRVVFTGFVPRTAPVLRSLDVVVHASTLPEPFGLAIAEAMACGRAAIVSAAGGAAEIVTAERDAIVHEPGDPASLAAAISRLVSSRVLRESLGRAARASALEKFDARTFAGAFAALYEKVALAGQQAR